MKWECDLGCVAPLPLNSMEEFEAHVRLHHPGFPVPFTTLPDGSLVIFDEPVDGRVVELEFGGTDG